jgi:hypothetical protein
MIMGVLGFSLERLLDSCHLLYKSVIHKYNVGIINIFSLAHLVGVDAYLVFLDIWLRVFVVHG